MAVQEPANGQEKKSPLSGIGGLSGWFSSLMGKPKSKTQEPAPKASPQKPKQEKQPAQTQSELGDDEDSVKQDIKKLSNLFGKVKSEVSQTVTPVAQKGAKGAEEKIEGAKSMVDTSLLKKLVQIFMILVFLLVLVFIGYSLFKNVETNNGSGTENGQKSTPTPTPTRIPFIPFRPSIYADDPVVNQLEEDINVLERELTRTNLREDRLLPPKLDFNIKFK